KSIATSSANKYAVSIGFNRLATLCPICFGCCDAETREDRQIYHGNLQQVHGKGCLTYVEPEPEYFNQI
ncbi:hypothetical protein V1521DRAFT_427060, partial [Lipomyces starkeyi]